MHLILELKTSLIYWYTCPKGYKHINNQVHDAKENGMNLRHNIIVNARSPSKIQVVVLELNRPN